MRVLITGAAGQDGIILSTQLCRERHKIIGIIKPGGDPSLLMRYAPCVDVVECDLADGDGLRKLVMDFGPEQIFNLGGISSIMGSYENPEQTDLVNVGAIQALLDGMRLLSRKAGVAPRLVQAASGAVFESAKVAPQSETLALAPRTPYAHSKAKAIRLLRTARESGLFGVSAILYNHESPLRGEQFVTRKISRAVARIARGQLSVLELGDIGVERDWGWAPDYVRAMRLMATAEVPRDYVLGSGKSHRLTAFIRTAFRTVGIEDWRSFVTTSTAHKRPFDTTVLLGDSQLAYRELGWSHTIDFNQIVAIMVHHDLRLLDDPEYIWVIPEVV